MKMKTKVRRQPPQKGGRIKQGAGFEPRVWRAVVAEANRFNVSIPFVLSVMAADTLGIELDLEARYNKKPLHVVWKHA
jgi:hypothetical protein